jgi:protein-disulfide isomerase
MNNVLGVPVAIIITGLIIGGAIVYSGSPGVGGNVNDSQKEEVANNENEESVAERGARVMDNIKPVTAEDHIMGSLDAPVKVVEFSDFECPFCQRFHPTMQRIVDESEGQVAWIYRHFPLDIHPKARKEAEASECAAELGGNEAFWKFTDRIYEITPANNRLDFAELANTAEFIGLNRVDFQECLDSDKYASHVEEDVQDAISSGGTGTPYSVVIEQDGTKTPIPGALPYESVKRLIEVALQ